MSKVKSFLSISIFVFSVFILHYLFNIVFQSASISFEKQLRFHVFIFIITSLVVLLSLKAIYTSPDKAGFTYLGLVLFKMVAAIVFLFPYLTDVTSETKKLVMHFFVILFLYLTYEVLFLLRHLNAEQNK
jgi:hypothetical protein